jgi:hypothetical protein
MEGESEREEEYKSIYSFWYNRRNDLSFFINGVLCSFLKAYIMVVRKLLIDYTHHLFKNVCFKYCLVPQIEIGPTLMNLISIVQIKQKKNMVILLFRFQILSANLQKGSPYCLK